MVRLPNVLVSVMLGEYRASRASDVVPLAFQSTMDTSAWAEAISAPTHICETGRSCEPVGPTEGAV